MPWVGNMQYGTLYCCSTYFIKRLIDSSSLEHVIYMLEIQKHDLHFRKLIYHISLAGTFSELVWNPADPSSVPAAETGANPKALVWRTVLQHNRGYRGYGSWEVMLDIHSQQSNNVLQHVSDGFQCHCRLWQTLAAFETTPCDSTLAMYLKAPSKLRPQHPAGICKMLLTCSPNRQLQMPRTHDDVFVGAGNCAN